MEPNKFGPLRVIKYKVLANGCWQWLGHVGTRGYGQLCINRRRSMAHRWYWEEVHGPIPPGMEIHHVCALKLCVNPEHMALVTAKGHALVDARHGCQIQRRKTRCPQGHRYSEDNVYLINGRRVCKICSRTRSREYQRKKRRQWQRS
jgi:HNH endonuclease